jgi:hypothetical protein
MFAKALPNRTSIRICRNAVTRPGNQKHGALVGGEPFNNKPRKTVEISA